MSLLLRFTFAVVAIAAAATPARGQCEVVRFTGCPNASAPWCFGSSRLGESLSFLCFQPPSRPLIRTTMWIGVPAAKPVTVGPPLIRTCGDVQCVIALDPRFSSSHSARNLVHVPIPDAPHLVGVTVWTQCATWFGSLGSHCVEIAPAMKFTIRR